MPAVLRADQSTSSFSAEAAVGQWSSSLFSLSLFLELGTIELNAQSDTF